MKRKPHHRLRITPLFLFLVLAAGSAASCSKMFGPDDATIATDIKAKMFSDPSLKSASVDVSSKGGEVTLTGQVPDDSARLAAYKIASEQKGVTKVNDQMTVMAAEAPSATPPAPEAMPAAPAPAREHAAHRSRSSASAAPTSDYAASPAAETAAPAPQPRAATVPSGTIITVRTIDPIDSSVNTTGQVFKASLDAPIVVGDHVVVPKGADAFLKLVSASSAGHFKGKSELTLEMQSVVVHGRTYDVTTSDVKESGTSRGKNSAEKIGGGAALGALIGGLAGGGKGAAIGAAVGGGAGTGVQIFTKGKQVKIPSETRLDFTLQEPFDVTYSPQRR